MYTVKGFLSITNDPNIGFVSAVTLDYANVIIDSITGKEVPRYAGYTFDYYKVDELPEQCLLRFIRNGWLEAEIRTTKAALVEQADDSIW